MGLRGPKNNVSYTTILRNTCLYCVSVYPFLDKILAQPLNFQYCRPIVNHKMSNMEKLSNITSVESKASFQERMVEKFVQQNLPPKLSKENSVSGIGILSAQYNEIECCAAELPVNGTVEIFFEEKNPDAIRGISIPSSSRFIVFCTREEKNDYKVTWSCSLS